MIRHFEATIPKDLLCPHCNTLARGTRTRQYTTTYMYGKVLGLNPLRRLFGSEFLCQSCNNNVLAFLPALTLDLAETLIPRLKKWEESDGQNAYILPTEMVVYVKNNDYRCGWFKNVSYCDTKNSLQGTMGFTCVKTNAPIRWHNPLSYSYRFQRRFPVDTGVLLGWNENDYGDGEMVENMCPVTIKGEKKMEICAFCSRSSISHPKLKFEVFYAVEGNHKQFCCNECALRHLDKKFFGFHFTKKSGRTDRKNPFARYVGLELETIGGEPFNYLQVPVEIRGLFKSVYDGSLHDSNIVGEEDDENSDVNSGEYAQDGNNDRRGSGREFVTIPMGKDQLFNGIDAVTSFLQKKGCEINKSCGFHCHFDMTKESIENVRKTFLVFSIFEDTLFNMLPDTRRKSKYCLPLRKEYKRFFANDFETYWYNDGQYGIDMRQHSKERWLRGVKHDKYNQTRYTSINYHALFYHGTLENRIHSGTLNATKIKNWILINQILIDFAIKTPMKRLLLLKGSRETLLNLIQSYEMQYPTLVQYALRNYVVVRTNRFANPKNNNSPIVVKQELEPNVVEKMQLGEALNKLYTPTPMMNKR